MFNPATIQESTYDPSVLVTRFTVLNEDRIIGTPYRGDRDIELTYQENYLSFEFAALDFAAPERNQYAYRLTGVDSDWISSEGRRYASYTNLKPGRYVFKVMGTNSDGRWSSQIASVPIYIAPALWQTTWFQITLMSLLVLLVIFLYRYKTLAVARRNHELERVVSARTMKLTRINQSLQLEVKLRQQAEEEIRNIAYHDFLTGLPNRRLFMSLGEQALLSAAREKTKAAVLFVDIDLFKEINDRWGHDAGDTVLAVLAERIRSVLRASDLVCRMGGDEFVLLLTDINGAQFASKVADKLIRAIIDSIEIIEPVTGNPQSVNIGVSIGISIYPDNETDLEKLLVMADQAMYEAKKEQRSGHRFYTESSV